MQIFDVYLYFLFFEFSRPAGYIPKNSVGIVYCFLRTNQFHIRQSRDLLFDEKLSFVYDFCTIGKLPARVFLLTNTNWHFSITLTIKSLVFFRWFSVTSFSLFANNFHIFQFIMVLAFSDLSLAGNNYVTTLTHDKTW